MESNIEEEEDKENKPKPINSDYGCEEYDVFERQNKIKKDIIEEQKDIFTLPLSKSESKMKTKKII